MIRRGFESPAVPVRSNTPGRHYYCKKHFLALLISTSSCIQSPNMPSSRTLFALQTEPSTSQHSHNYSPQPVSTCSIPISSCPNPVALFSYSLAIRRQSKRYLNCFWKTNFLSTDLELTWTHSDCNSCRYSPPLQKDIYCIQICILPFIVRTVDTVWL